MKKLLTVCAALCVAMSTADARSRSSGRECKDRIEATGAAAIRLSKAEKNATKAWQHRVVNAYGERFADLEHARRVRKHCRTLRADGSLSPLRLHRCSVAAYPCAIKP